MLTVVHDADQANDNAEGSGRSLLDEIVRDVARQMLAAALQAEVAALVKRGLLVPVAGGVQVGRIQPVSQRGRSG